MKVKTKTLVIQIPEEMHVFLEKVALEKGFTKIQQFLKPDILELLKKLEDKYKEK